MSDVNILSEEFARLFENAVSAARRSALDAGQPVVYIDSVGRCVQEEPDGRCFEIHLDPAKPRKTHRMILRELSSHAA